MNIYDLQVLEAGHPVLTDTVTFSDALVNGIETVTGNSPVVIRGSNGDEFLVVEAATASCQVAALTGDCAMDSFGTTSFTLDPITLGAGGPGRHVRNCLRPAGSATIANSGSNRERRTIAGRRPKRR
jgi:hypothetical protein